MCVRVCVCLHRFLRRATQRLSLRGCVGAPSRRDCVIAWLCHHGHVGESKAAIAVSSDEGEEGGFDEEELDEGEEEAATAVFAIFAFGSSDELAEGE